MDVSGLQGDGVGPLGGVRGWDEEDERQLWLTAIQQAALQALGQRELLRDESQLLEHAVKVKPHRLRPKWHCTLATQKPTESRPCECMRAQQGSLSADVVSQRAPGTHQSQHQT